MLSDKIQEKIESIEQLRLIVNDYKLYSVSVEPSLPSINEPGDEEILYNYIKDNKTQLDLLEEVLRFK